MTTSPSMPIVAPALPPHICFIAHHVTPEAGGMAGRVWRMAVALRGLGIRASVIAGVESRGEDVHAEVYRWDRAGRQTARRLVRQLEPDAVVVCDERAADPPAAAMAAAARLVWPRARRLLWLLSAAPENVNSSGFDQVLISDDLATVSSGHVVLSLPSSESEHTAVGAESGWRQAAVALAALALDPQRYSPIRPDSR